MKILAENTEPIILSKDKVGCVLPFNAEYERALQKSESETGVLFLRFENIFGSTHCPNYDINVRDDSQSVELIHLGVVSFFGARPKSNDNLHGTAQSVKIRDRAANWIFETLLRYRQLPLLLVAQEPQTEGHGAIIEFVYLCSEEKL